MKDGQLNLADAQLRQWRNRAINDTYGQPSTFKVLTLAAALEEGVIDENTTFDCTGSIHVLDATIHCSNRAGHGHQTLEQTAATPATRPSSPTGCAWVRRNSTVI